MDIEKVLGIAKLRPVQPLDVARVLDIDSNIAGAVLSDLVSKKVLKVSNLKSGSSPLYFMPGNEAQLLNFLNFLNSKDKETVDLLKEKKVLRASRESPLIRVSLQNIKDFAIPLEVIKDDKKELFYKWFLLKDDEATELIKEFFSEKPSVKKEVKEVKEVKDVNEVKTVVETPVAKKIETKEIKKVKQKKLVDKIPKSIETFFSEKNIVVVEVIKKRAKEVEQILSMPTPVGRINFYCKFLTKAKIADTDISTTLMNAQLRKLPGILLYSGELNATAKDLSNKISDIIIKRI